MSRSGGADEGKIRRVRDFEDHFSEQAREYARSRPQYPSELFAWLASVAPGRRLAWDCGTGNGQAALGLAVHFERVVATDPSRDQLKLAVPHERIEYRLERAEEVLLEAGSVDLVTAAVAAHWFDLGNFYETVRRAAVPGGVIAVWTYHLPVIAPAVDLVLGHYFSDVLAGFWPARIRYVDERYRTLPFPFGELTPPGFEMHTIWSMDQVTGFLYSWSATQRYLRERGENPLERIGPALREAWGDRATREVTWPLHLRVGRIP